MITGPFTFIGELSCNFSFFSKMTKYIQNMGEFSCVAVFCMLIFLQDLDS